jgi:hypothetical protein
MYIPSILMPLDGTLKGLVLGQKSLKLKIKLMKLKSKRRGVA